MGVAVDLEFVSIAAGIRYREHESLPITLNQIGVGIRNAGCRRYVFRRSQKFVELALAAGLRVGTVGEQVLRKGFDEPAHVRNVNFFDSLHQHVGKIDDRIPNDVCAFAVRTPRAIRVAEVRDQNGFTTLQLDVQGRA